MRFAISYLFLRKKFMSYTNLDTFGRFIDILHENKQATQVLATNDLTSQNRNLQEIQITRIWRQSD